MLILSSSAGPSGGSSPESLQYFARVPGLDTRHFRAFDRLITGLAEDGLWAAFDCLYVFATDIQAHALINLIAGTYQLAVVGTPTFTADAGFTGVDGAAPPYLNTGFNPVTAPSPQFTQNSGHLACWIMTEGVATAVGGTAMGNLSGGGITQISPWYPAGNLAYYGVNAPSINQANEVVSTALGFRVATRSAANNSHGFRNGTQVASSPANSVAPASLNMFILGRNDNGTATSGLGNQVSMASIGDNLTNLQVATYYNRMRSYLQAIYGSAPQ